MTAPRLELTWDDVVALTADLVARLDDAPFDLVLAVSRGGLVPAAILCSLLDVRDVRCAALASYAGEEQTDGMTVYHFPPDDELRGRAVLIVDDIWDSGRTAVAVRDRVAAAGGRPIVAVLHYKPTRSAHPESRPDVWVVTTDAWVVYPWEALRQPGRSSPS